MGKYVNMDFVFKNNEKTGKKVVNPQTHEIKDVHKIVIWNHTSYNIIIGFQFFTKNNTLIAQTTATSCLKEPYIKQEFILNEGERIVGIQARTYNEYAYFYDFQFVIGCLE